MIINKKKTEKLIKNYNIFDKKKEEKSDFNEHGININGLDRNGYNINSVEGTRRKYPKRKVNYREVDDGLYDQYGFNSEGFNKDGYNIYGFNRIGFNSEGFNIDGLNKDGLNKFGYTEKIGKGLNISALPILLTNIYANNTVGPSSKNLIKNVKQLVNNLYKNKQITKKVYNILNKALINNDSYRAK